MWLYLIVFLGFALAVTGLAVGLFFKRKPLQGSCGGLNNLDGNDGTCSICGATAQDQCQEPPAGSN